MRVVAEFIQKNNFSALNLGVIHISSIIFFSMAIATRMLNAMKRNSLTENEL